LNGSPARVLRYIGPSDLKYQSLYFLAEFVACPVWLDLAESVPPVFEPLLARIRWEPPSRSEFWCAASVLLNDCFTTSIISHWELAPDFEIIESALYLNRVLTTNCEDQRPLILAFIERSLDGIAWCRPDCEIDLFHLFIIDPVRATERILGQWRLHPYTSGFFSLDFFLIFCCPNFTECSF
jgi:hypothetical protein